ncbi:MAG: hypothetical protein JNK40_13465 [Chromatiales bacterium]|nr:hypothetical protein [Chromatiales bacterium]
MRQFTLPFPVMWTLIHLAVLGAASAAFWLQWRAPAGSLVLQRAVVSGPAAVGAEVALPDDWRLRGSDARRQDYDFSFELPVVPTVPWAVLLPSVRMHAVASVNGHLLGDPATLKAPIPRTWHRPLLFTISPALLIPGENHLRIQVAAANPGTGFLDRPQVATLATLAPVAAGRHLVQQTLVLVIIGTMTAVAVLILLLWLMRRRESVFGLYALGMVLWAGHTLNFVVQHPPVSQRLWESWAYLTLGAFTAVATCFLHRYLGLTRPGVERAAFGVLLVSLPFFLLLPDTRFVAFGDGIFNSVVMAFGFYVLATFHVEAWRRRSQELQILAAAGTVVVVFALHDTLVGQAMLPWASGYVLHYSASVVLLAFSALLVVRLARSMTAVERMNEEMNRRVTAVTADLEEGHRRVRELERVQFLGAERERIARDMHDGVGGQLIALLARARGGRLSLAESQSALTGAIEDLRLVIDSLEITEGDLATALAKFRHRLERRLRGTGIALRWQPGEAVSVPGYGPAEVLHLLRLLDEAASNVIVHAGASEIVISYREEAGRVEISFADNGRGGAAGHPGGNGMRNMQRRSQLLGAQLLIESDAAGTRLLLVITPGMDEAGAGNRR